MHLVSEAAALDAAHVAEGDGGVVVDLALVEAVVQPVERLRAEREHAPGTQREPSEVSSAKN